uniref:Zn(2)-C6 fungal-type domain-containing protein n=1 Tax=Psilocybe cubensis TaxID=181762 RepID=A0A8H7XVF9_PSICU
MISDSLRGSKAPSKAATKPLKRGRACMSCRFLKIKCDGEKPVCGPCRNHPRDDECEYSDGPGRSRTKTLEEQVSRLEARILELEHPDSSTPSVVLHDPYPSPFQVERHSKSPPLHLPEHPPAFAPLSPFSPTSTTSSLPSGRHWNKFSALGEKTELTGSSGSSTSPIRHPVAMPYLGAEEPSYSQLQASLDVFFLHAPHFGFFLNSNSFRHSALLAFNLGHPSRPTPGLLNVVHLLGLHFSQPEAFQGQESALLIRAVQHVSTDLMGTHPNKVIHTLQAEVLLAYYFLRTGSLLEAKCRTGTAISLALGSGLHKIRSANFLVPSTISIGSHDQAHLLPHPSDALQEAERINGFWAVLVLHKFITVALEVPAHVCGALEAPGMLIDTPWPIDIDQFEEGIIPPELQGNSTVRAFLNGYLVDNHNGESSTALVAKAAILFHRAAHLTGQWSPSMHIPSLIVAIINSMIFEDMTPRDKVAYDAAAKSVNTLLETFRAKLGVRPRLNPQDPSVRTILLIHALVDAASIKLHWIFSYAYPESKQICLSAARNIVNYGDFDLQGLTIINPIMGNLWMTACLVFVDEISRARQMRSGWPEHASVEEELMESYRSGLKAMSLFSQDSVLMRYQLTKVQEAFEVI